MDRFGPPVVPREWFLVPLFVIKEAVEKNKDGSSLDIVTIKIAHPYWYTHDRSVPSGSFLRYLEGTADTRFHPKSWVQSCSALT